MKVRALKNIPGTKFKKGDVFEPNKGYCNRLITGGLAEPAHLLPRVVEKPKPKGKGKGQDNNNNSDK